MKTSIKSTVAVSTMKKGFTLVELLFVMAVISILAGFGISQMSGSTDAATNTVAKGNVMSVVTEATLYFAENSADYTGFTTAIGGDDLTITVANSGKSYCVQQVGVDKTYKYDSSTDSSVAEGTCSGGNQITMG